MLKASITSVGTQGWYPLDPNSAFELSTLALYGWGWLEVNKLAFDRAVIFDYEGKTTILACPKRSGIVHSQKRVTYIKGVADPCL